ncbi:hypothetical protein NE237_021826 [Protea cynaroides]|uniref:Uncharacterized protein n=1 Tax=Protea cynaroides TaxID=273540 RepID=A0A9Q0HAY4_9MAGN|nr:hypothetical protein NE237_021826 [Protea cynaroides]
MHLRKFERDGRENLRSSRAGEEEKRNIRSSWRRRGEEEKIKPSINSRGREHAETNESLEVLQESPAGDEETLFKLRVLGEEETGWEWERKRFARETNEREKRCNWERKRLLPKETSWPRVGCLVLAALLLALAAGVGHVPCTWMWSIASLRCCEPLACGSCCWLVVIELHGVRGIAAGQWHCCLHGGTCAV